MKVDLRKPTEEDMLRFRECLERDDDHAGQDAEAWAAAPAELWTMFDDEGNRVWFSIERVLRVNIQHDPDSSKLATAQIIYRGFAWLQSAARLSGFTEVIFESTAKQLIHFCQKRFGFAKREHDYSTRKDTPCVDPAASKLN